MARIFVGPESVWTRRVDADRVGVTLQPVPDFIEVGYVRRDDAWVTANLDAHWSVAYMLVVQDGRLVIGEVRIMPREQSNPPGVWSGNYKGVKAVVPPGGITTTVIDKVTPGRHVQSVRPLLKQKNLLRALLAASGMTTAQGPKRAGVGAKGKTRPFYERVAKVYQTALSNGSRRPTEAVGRRLGITRSQAGYAVYRARLWGLLPPTRKGKASAL